jgi:hypothetical protein
MIIRSATNQLTEILNSLNTDTSRHSLIALILNYFDDKNNKNESLEQLQKLVSKSKEYIKHDLINAVFSENRDKLIDYDTTSFLINDQKFIDLKDIRLKKINFTTLSENAYNNFISFIKKLSESKYEYTDKNGNKITQVRELFIESSIFVDNTDISHLLSSKNTKIENIVISKNTTNLIIDFDKPAFNSITIDIINIYKESNVQINNLNKAPEDLKILLKNEIYYQHGSIIREDESIVARKLRMTQNKIIYQHILYK